LYWTNYKLHCEENLTGSTNPEFYSPPGHRSQDQDHRLWISKAIRKANLILTFLLDSEAIMLFPKKRVELAGLNNFIIRQTQ
jgi:hypothetical protein